MKKNIIYIIIGSSLIVGGVTYAVLRRRRADKILSEIIDILDKGIEQYGDSRDLSASKAFDPLFWQTEKDSSKLLEWRDARATAKEIEDCFGFWKDNEEKFFNIMNSIKNAIQFSQINYQYKSLYGATILERIESNLSNDEKKMATTIIKSKKLS